MSKTTSAILLSILIAVLLFVCVFSFLPDDLPYGDYEEYHAAINLIKKGSDLGESEQYTYTLLQNDLTDDQFSSLKQSVAKTAEKRIRTFGVYDYVVEWKNGNLIVSVPKVGSYDYVLDSVSSNGVIEFFTSSTYSDGGAFLDNNYITKMTKQHYSYESTNMWIVKVYVNETGKKLLSNNSSTTTAYLSVDRSTSMSSVNCSISEKYLQFYLSSETYADELISWVKSGTYESYLSEDVDSYDFNLIKLEQDTVDPSFANGGLITGIVVAALVIIAIAVALITHRAFGFAYALSLIFVLLLEVIFAAFVYFNSLNIWAVVGVVITIGLITYMSFDSFKQIQKSYATGKTVKSATNTGYNKSIVKNLIVNGSALVLGIILWVIPTAITSSLGLAIFFGAIASFAATLGLNRVFSMLLYPLYGEKNTNYGLSK